MSESLPARGGFITDDDINAFNADIKQVMSDMGKPVRLFFEPIASGCPNCLALPNGMSNGQYDSSNPFQINGPLHKPFPNGSRCFVCQGSHKIYLQQDTETYTSLIKYFPEDTDIGPEGNSPDQTIRTKMVISARNDIKRSKKAIIDGKECVRIREEVPRGIQAREFVVAWWKVLNNG